MSLQINPPLALGMYMQLFSRLYPVLNVARYLTADADVWSKNAWDHVPPPDDQDERITTSIARQRARPVPEDEKPKYNDKPAKHW